MFFVHSHQWAAEALTSVASRGTLISGQPRQVPVTMAQEVVRLVPVANVQTLEKVLCHLKMAFPTILHRKQNLSQGKTSIT